MERKKVLRFVPCLFFLPPQTNCRTNESFFTNRFTVYTPNKRIKRTKICLLPRAAPLPLSLPSLHDQTTQIMVTSYNNCNPPLRELIF